MIFVHTTLRRLRGRSAAVAVILVVATAVAWAHTGPGMDHMQMSDVVAVCLAIEGFAVATLAGATAAAGLHGPPHARAPLHHQIPPPAPSMRARDGPAVLQVFRI